MRKNYTVKFAGFVGLVMVSMPAFAASVGAGNGGISAVMCFTATEACKGSSKPYACPNGSYGCPSGWALNSSTKKCTTSQTSTSDSDSIGYYTINYPSSCDANMCYSASDSSSSNITGVIYDCFACSSGNTNM